MSFTLVDSKEQYGELHEKIAGNKLVFGADIESTGLDWFVDEILLFQLMIGNEIFVIDIRSLGYDYLRAILEVIDANGHDVIFHNAKFDLKFLYHRTGVMLEHVYDTMVAEAVLNSGKGKTFYSLAELAEKYCDVFMDKESRMEFVNFPKDMPFTEKMLQYSALDVKYLPEIFSHQWREFQETSQTHVGALEMELIPVVAKMEYDGIRLDSKMWLEVEKEAIIKRDELVKEFDEKIVDFILNLKADNGLELAQKVCIPVRTKKLERFLVDITDISLMKGWLSENFNVKSPKQLFTILQLMKIRVKNTNAKILQEFIDTQKVKYPLKSYPILELLLQIRKVNKQIDQYGSSFLESIHAQTGKVHTEYFTVGTQTGRFSSNRPNLQNVPRKGGYRECFIPEEGYLFCAVDYSQQEYRLAGAVSGDPVIISAYQNGSDMHTATAAVIFGKPMEEITSEERNIGKTVNFAILYGSTEWGLQRNLRIPLEDAKDIIIKFWAGYQSLSRFMDLAGKMILERGFSVTPLKRRRYNLEKPHMMNSNEHMRWVDRVLREGRNHIIQGGGADIIKIAMVEIYKRNPFGDGLKLCLQIHDEIVTQVRKDIAEQAMAFIVSVMEEVEQKFLKAIPAKADGKLKERWSK